MKILDLSAAVIIGVIAVSFLMMSGDLGRTAALFPKILSVTIIGLVVVYIGVQIYIDSQKPSLKSSGKEAGVKMSVGGKCSHIESLVYYHRVSSASIWD